MGHRICISIVSLTVLGTASCGHPVESTARVSSSSAASTSARPSPTANTAKDPAPPYRAAGPELVFIATAFAHEVGEYNARREGPRDFIGRLRGIAAPAELRRLTHSPRARLPWRILRARAERTSLTIDGVTLERGAGDRRQAIVEATVSTHTTFADVAIFRESRLSLVRAGDGWLVTDAEGLGS